MDFPGQTYNHSELEKKSDFTDSGGVYTVCPGNSKVNPKSNYVPRERESAPDSFCSLEEVALRWHKLNIHLSG